MSITQEKNENEKQNVMEAGKVYNIYNVSMDEVAITVVPRKDANILEFAKELNTILKYAADSRETFFPMFIRLINSYLTADVNFANASYEDVTPKDNESEVEIVDEGTEG